MTLAEHLSQSECYVFQPIKLNNAEALELSATSKSKRSSKLNNFKTSSSQSFRAEEPQGLTTEQQYISQELINEARERRKAQKSKKIPLPGTQLLKQLEKIKK